LFFFRRAHPISDEELSAYADGEIADAARARVEAHLEGCAACRETVSELRAVRGALGALPRPAAPRSFVLREADVRPQEAPRPAGAFGRAAPALGGVAMVAFLAFWALVGIDVAGRPSGGGMAPESAQLAMRNDTTEAPSLEATGAAGAQPPGEEGQPSTDLLARTPPALPYTGPATEATEPAADERASAGDAEDEGEDSTTLRAGEAAAAAVALVAVGSLVLVWRRRRA